MINPFAQRGIMMVLRRNVDPCSSTGGNARYCGVVVPQFVDLDDGIVSEYILQHLKNFMEWESGGHDVMR